MTTLLRIDVSPRPDSLSRRFADRLSRALAQSQGHRLITRDLARQPLPHVDATFVEAQFTPQQDRTAAHHGALALSERLIAELEAADVLVIGTPLHNYGVPSALKAWIDHVVRARRTFRMTPDGPVGFLRDRPVYLVTAAGGLYSRGPGVALDFLTPWLRAVLGKIGLADIRVLAIEGHALGPDAMAETLARAEADLERLLGRVADLAGAGAMR